MIETRIPVPRLVDWVDQAILYLHTKDQPTAGDANQDEASQDGASQDGANQRNDQPKAAAANQDSELCGRLRSFGIRTATDLLKVHSEAEKRNALDAFYATVSDGNSAAKLPRIQIIIDALKDDEWLNHIQHWRECVTVEEVTRTIPARPATVPATKTAAASAAD